VAGVPTIAYGHRILPTESFPDGIAEAQGADLLARDVSGAENAVERLVKVELAQCQFDALVDFVYNLGPRKLEASTLLRTLNIGRYGARPMSCCVGIMWACVKTRLESAPRGRFLLWHSADSGSNRLRRERASVL